MKKVLVLYFSQSGQLGDILTRLTEPLKQAGHSVEEVRVMPKEPYPFPWKGNSFFRVMPDCVLGNTSTQLKEFNLKETNYDLIVLGYQAWFLSPSLPSQSILADPQVQQVLRNTPVVAVTGARNMWISAMERIKASLKTAGSKLVGHVALVDKHANAVSFVTILYWMMTGKRDRFLNIFPKPGVSDEDVNKASQYGSLVLQHLETGTWDGLQDQLLQKKAVEVKYSLMFIESKARRIFRLWANFISKRKNKDLWLQVFKYYIIVALFLVAPIILTVDAIFFRPFLQHRIKKQKLLYSGIH